MSVSGWTGTGQCDSRRTGRDHDFGRSQSWVGTTGGDASSGWLRRGRVPTRGTLIGVGDPAYPAGQYDERFYAHARLIKSFWGDLAGGKDADLRGSGPPGSDPRLVRRYQPDTTLAQIARDRAVAATVRMREVTKQEDPGWNGVLVDKDGLIVTWPTTSRNPGQNSRFARRWEEYDRESDRLQSD